MATTSRPNISSKFENNDIPTEEHFGQIIESFVHKDDKADFQMVEIGTDNEHYITPALLNVGLQNIGIITGNSYMPKKEYFDISLTGATTLSLEEFPIPNSVRVYKNGQLLQEGEGENQNYDYTVNYNTAIITFSGVVSDRNIEVDYWYKNLSPNPGTGGGETGEPIDFSAFLHTTGNETKSGILTFNNTTPSSTSGIVLTNSGNGVASKALDITVSGSGSGISLQNSSTGKGVYLNSTTEATGDILQVAKNNVVKAKIDNEGNVTAGKFVTSAGLRSEFVKGDGFLDPTVYAEDSKALHTTGEESKDGALTLTNSLEQDVLTIEKSNDANCLKLVQNSNSSATTSTWDTSTDIAERKAISIRKVGDETAFITHDGDVTARSFSTPKANLTDDGLFSLENRPSPESSEGKAKLYAKNDGTDTHMYVMGSDGVEKKIGGDVDLSEYAKLDSPVFNGTPNLPTGTTGVTQPTDNATTAIATTAFVNNVISSTNNGLVTITQNQTITGQKTFSGHANFASIGLTNSYILSLGNGLDSISTYGNGAIGFKNGHFSFASVGKPSAIIATSNVTLTTNPILQVPNSSGTIALTNNPTSITATSFIKSGGTNTQYLMADGSVSTSTSQTPILPYKVYTAFLSQTGTSAPIATVLENTLGGTVVWTRTGVGQYLATCSVNLTIGKTVVDFKQGRFSISKFEQSPYNGNSVMLHTLTQTSFNVFSFSDNLIGQANWIEIRVYN